MRAQPEHASAWYNLGVVQRDAGKAADAEHSYRTATKLSPTHKDATNGLATLLWSKVSPQPPPVTTNTAENLLYYCTTQLRTYCTTVLHS